MKEARIPRKALEILDFLITHGKPESVVVYEGTQEEIAKNVFGYKSRQALHQHLKVLREHGLVRTGRGFVEVTQKGLMFVGLQKQLAFVLIKARVNAIDDVLAKLHDMGIAAFKVTGEWDVVAVTELSKVSEIMRISGIEDTITLVVIRALKLASYL